MKAPDEKERKAQSDRAEDQQQKHRRDDGEFHRCRAFLALAYGLEMITHGQPNLIMANLVMGVGKMLATLSPGNSDL